MTGELVRLLVAVRDPEALADLRAALPREEGYILTEADPATGAASDLDWRSHDLLVLELGVPGAERLRQLALNGGERSARPIVVLADAERESEARRAVRGGCADFLIAGELSEPVVSRTIRFAIERTRSDRQRRAAERALVESEQRYRSLFEQSRDAIFMTERTGEILEVNQATLDLLGYDEDELIGQDVLSVYADPGDRERFRAEIEAGGHVRDFEVRLRRRGGEELWCLVSAWVRRDRDGDVRGYQGIVRDITDRKLVEDQLVHDAFHDSLTGLPNRALFMDRLDRAVARRRRGDESDLAVLFMDIDRFKVVNDSLGHLMGDELLRQMGRVLASEIRDGDTVARMGGDEFAILLDGVEDPADPTHVAERIQQRFRTPFHLRGHDVFASVSIGITVGGGGSEGAEELLRDADTAMYRAKESGPARYQIFDVGMHAHAVSLLQLETDLRLALERREFVLHYQPVLELASGRLIGFEALVRWQHPSRGLLQPQSFIPVAEDTGLIVPLGEWVLRTAARQLRVWQERQPGRRELFVAVNLSARQFSHSDIVEVVRDVLEETGLAGGSLRLELTESVVMQSPEAAMRMLGELRDMGVGLCIDDFGTGYSSLGYLHDFPIDTLKIDRSFIARMAGRGTSDIVATIVALARNLGMAAVAEGVETEAQLERLRELGPTSAQGFLFSTPLDEQAAGALLDDTLPSTAVRSAGSGASRRSGGRPGRSRSAGA